MRRSALPLAAALGFIAGPAAAKEISFGTSGSYSTGKHGGSEPTELSILSASASATMGGWEVSATLPYLQVEVGTGEELSLGGVLIRSHERRKISGFGDVVVTAGRTLPLDDDLPFDLAVQGQLKLPTGRSSLSSGKADAGVELQISRPFGAAEPYLLLGRRFYGDAPALDLKDSWAASAGVTLTCHRIILIASYDWEQSPIGLPDAHDLFLVASAPFGSDWSLTLFGSKGLSDGSADVMLGVGMTRQFRKSGAPRAAR